MVRREDAILTDGNRENHAAAGREHLGEDSHRLNVAVRFVEALVATSQPHVLNRRAIDDLIKLLISERTIQDVGRLVAKRRVLKLQL